MKSKARTTMLVVRAIFERVLLLRFFRPIFACTEAFYLHSGLLDHVNRCKQVATLKIPSTALVLPCCPQEKSSSNWAIVCHVAGRDEDSAGRMPRTAKNAEN